MLNLAPDVAHGTMSKAPQALALRTRECIYMCVLVIEIDPPHEETRKTYRAILSEPRLVIPGSQPQLAPSPLQEAGTSSTSTPTSGTKRPFDDVGDTPSENLLKTEPRSSKKRKNKQR